MDKQAVIVEFRRIVENLQSNNKDKKILDQIIKLSSEAKDIIGFDDPDFLRILNSLETAIKFYVDSNKIKECSVLAENYIGILEEFNNPAEIISRSKNIANSFFGKKESSYHIFMEDLLNRVTYFLDEKDQIELLGDFLVAIGNNLHKLKIHELAVNYFDKGLNYFIDLNENEKITVEIQKLLEIARDLATKNDEFSRLYIELVNKISRDANIDINNEVSAQLAYQSYSDHLLKTSKNMVESRVVHTGRIHKKKRDLFKKKGLKEE